MESIKALMRLGQKKVDPSGQEINITPETIIQLIREVEELRRWAKHIQVELDDLREKIR